MERLIKVTKSVFENFDETQFHENLLLGDIPGWDSMNSVNFQSELESVFSIDFSEIVLTGTHRISDVIAQLVKMGVTFYK